MRKPACRSSCSVCYGGEHQLQLRGMLGSRHLGKRGIDAGESVSKDLRVPFGQSAFADRGERIAARAEAVHRLRAGTLLDRYVPRTVAWLVLLVPALLLALINKGERADLSQQSFRPFNQR